MARQRASAPTFDVCWTALSFQLYLVAKKAIQQSRESQYMTRCLKPSKGVCICFKTEVVSCVVVCSQIQMLVLCV